MNCIQYENANDFLTQCEEFMAQNESANNLIIGLAKRVASTPSVATAPLFYGILDNNKVVGAALRTDRNRPLSVTSMPTKAVICLFESINESLAGIIGEISTADAFAQLYKENTNSKTSTSMDQLIYQLEKVEMPHTHGATMIKITEDHRDVVKRFYIGFLNDCFPDDEFTEEDLKVMLDRFIAQPSSYLLQTANGKLVSMAAILRETENTSCISYVYTPPEERGNGYASILTALLSQKALDSGKKFCNLFTDKSNPTSNSIYQKIGYMMIGESKHISFSCNE